MSAKHRTARALSLIKKTFGNYDSAIQKRAIMAMIKNGKKIAI